MELDPGTAMTAQKGSNHRQCALGDRRAQRPRKLRRRICREASWPHWAAAAGRAGAGEMNDELAEANRPEANLLALGMKRVAAQTRRGMA